MLWKRVLVRDHERFVVTKNNRFDSILTPGTHRLFMVPGFRVELTKADVRDIVFRSKWADYLISNRPDVVERHFTLVETSEVQVAMVYEGGNLLLVMTPAQRVLLWKGSADVTAEIVEVLSEADTQPAASDIFDGLLDGLIDSEVPTGAR